jgi:hypothetical protein
MEEDGVLIIPIYEQRWLRNGWCCVKDARPPIGTTERQLFQDTRSTRR